MRVINRCYFCNVDLTETNSSVEHIIPNALGEKLKAKILCTDCNSNSGAKLEAELSKKLDLFRVRPYETHLDLQVRRQSCKWVASSKPLDFR